MKNHKKLEELADSLGDPLEMTHRRLEKKKAKIEKLQEEVRDLEAVIKFATLAFNSVS